MKRAILGATAFLAWVLSAVSPAAADDYTIGVRARLWNATMTGDVRVDDDNLVGSAIDIDDTLDLTEGEKVFEGIFTFKPLRNSRFDLSYWANAFKGERRLTGDVNYNGRTYTLGTLLESDLDMRVATLTYQYILPTPNLAAIKIEAGPLIGVKLISFDGELSAVDAPVPFSSTDDLTAPIPVIGARASIALSDWISVEAEIQGITINNFSDVGGTLIEAQGEILVNVWRGLSFGGGYHRFIMDAEDESGSSGDRFKGDMTIDGFFASAAFRF